MYLSPSRTPQAFPSFSLLYFSMQTCHRLSSSLCFQSLEIWFSYCSLCASVPISVSVYLYQSFFLSVFSFSAFTFFPVCAPWHSFRPSYPGSVDVRPGLIDQTINYPCIASALLIACLTSRLRPYREREERGGTGSSAGRERESPANC